MSNEHPVAKGSRNTNIPFLDILRGLAALLVVFYHSQDVIVSKTPALASNMLYHTFKFGNLGVELFFVISGYCILAAALNGIERGKSIQDFVWARVRRIFPAYWVSLIATILVSALMAFLVHKGIIAASESAGRLGTYLSPTVLLTNISLTQLAFRLPSISIVAWTLCYEVAFYLICVVIMLATAKAKKPGLMLLLGVHLLTALILVWQIVFPGMLTYPLDMWAMFGLGAAVFHCVRAERTVSEEQSTARGWTVALLVLAVGVILRGPNTTLSIMHHPTAIGFGVAIFGVGILWLVRNVSQGALGKVGQGIGFIGGFSYSLYLIHFLCIGLANQAFYILKLPEQWHYVHFAIMVAVSIAAGFVFFLIAEKPSMRKTAHNPDRLQKGIQSPI